MGVSLKLAIRMLELYKDLKFTNDTYELYYCCEKNTLKLKDIQSEMHFDEIERFNLTDSWKVLIDEGNSVHLVIKDILKKKKSTTQYDMESNSESFRGEYYPVEDGEE